MENRIQIRTRRKASEMYVWLCHYICKTLCINLDSKICKISLGALIGHVSFTDEAREIGNAVFL